MSELVGKMQTQFKTSSSGILLFFLKLFSGLVLGLTFALVAEVMLGYAEGESILLLVFVTTVIAGLFLRMSRSWSMTTLLVFDLICILVGMLIRLYILIAPDA